MDDEIKEECGIFGIKNHPDSAMPTVLGLFALQHRGEEACGVISVKDGKMKSHTGTGLVNKNFYTSIKPSFLIFDIFSILTILTFLDKNTNTKNNKV